jgi:predicted dehydrogenase
MKRTVGIVGAGAIVEDAHLPILRNLPDVAVAWISDIDAERARLLGRMYDVPVVAASEAAARIADVDICLLAVPLGARKPYVEACARLGKAVYSEKPFAATRQEHQAYCSSFTDFRIAAGFQRRYYRSALAMKELVATQLFGALVGIDFRYGQYSLQSGGRNRYVSNASLAGGGMIIESAIHGLDQILFVTAPESVTVTEAAAVVMLGLDFDTVTRAELRLDARTVPVACEITRLRNVSQGFIYRFERATVHCALAPDSPLRVTASASPGAATTFELVPERGGDSGAQSINEAFTRIWRDFIRGLDERRPNASTASASLLTTGWVEDIYRRIVRA